jgi:hypothetical protein
MGHVALASKNIYPEASKSTMLVVMAVVVAVVVGGGPTGYESYLSSNSCRFN